MEIVNGYPCKNCTDVENARKGIDPAKPQAGPNGVNAIDAAKEADKSRDAAKTAADGPADRGPAVTLSGALAEITPPDEAQTAQAYRPGSTFSFAA